MKNLIIFFIILSLFLSMNYCFAQDSTQLPTMIKQYHLNSKNYLHDTAKLNSLNDYTLIFNDTISIPGAVWLKLKFKDYNLGNKSYIIITSLKNGDYQRLDKTSLKQWNNSSGIFSGNAVEIALFESHSENNVFFEIDEVFAGTQEIASILSLCGSDDRVRINDPRVGRFVRSDGTRSGTVWLGSNGAILTAGHAAGVQPDAGASIEFNIRSSNSNGYPVPSAEEDIYAIDYSTVVFIEGGTGNDWAVFRCFPNPITKLMPHQKQNDFFRMTKEAPSTNEITRITGCGVDDGVDNQTIQTSTGPYAEETIVSSTRIYHGYEVDTENNNSGSPIIWEANGFTIGIHTNGGCDSPYYGANFGTSFENDNLENALQNLYSINTVYVDSISQSPIEDGTIFSPYNTVTEGITATLPGGNLYITTGTYNNNSNLTINKPMTILPPACGTVVINP